VAFLPGGLAQQGRQEQNLDAKPQPDRPEHDSDHPLPPHRWMLGPARGESSTSSQEYRHAVPTGGSSNFPALSPMSEEARARPHHPKVRLLVPTADTQGVAEPELASRRAGRVAVDGDRGRVPPRILSVAYVVIREALANAAEHASGTNVTVRALRQRGRAGRHGWRRWPRVHSQRGTDRQAGPSPGAGHDPPEGRRSGRQAPG
jgi:hypothetical protein